MKFRGVHVRPRQAVAFAMCLPLVALGLFALWPAAYTYHVAIWGDRARFNRLAWQVMPKASRDTFSGAVLAMVGDSLRTQEEMLSLLGVADRVPPSCGVLIPHAEISEQGMRLPASIAGDPSRTIFAYFAGSNEYMGSFARSWNPDEEVVRWLDVSSPELASRIQANEAGVRRRARDAVGRRVAIEVECYDYLIKELPLESVYLRLELAQGGVLRGSKVWN